MKVQYQKPGHSDFRCCWRIFNNSISFDYNLDRPPPNNKVRVLLIYLIILSPITEWLSLNYFSMLHWLIPNCAPKLFAVWILCGLFLLHQSVLRIHFTRACALGPSCLIETCSLPSFSSFSPLLSLSPFLLSLPACQVQTKKYFYPEELRINQLPIILQVLTWPLQDNGKLVYS